MRCSIIHSTCQKTLLAPGKRAAFMMVSYTDFLITDTVSTGILLIIHVNNIIALLDILMLLDIFNSDT